MLAMLSSRRVVASATDRAMMLTTLRGLISGARCLEHADLDLRLRRVASRLLELGRAAGDCVALLLRHASALLEASFAAQTLGPYAVPINWHFKADEIAYILADSAAKVLFAHADLLAALAERLPPQLSVIAVDMPPEVATAYGLEPVTARSLAGALDYDSWLPRQPAYGGVIQAAPLTMFYTSGTTGTPKGVRRPAPTPARPEER